MNAPPRPPHRFTSRPGSLPSTSSYQDATPSVGSLPSLSPLATHSPNPLPKSTSRGKSVKFIMPPRSPPPSYQPSPLPSSSRNDPCPSVRDSHPRSSYHSPRAEMPPWPAGECMPRRTIQRPIPSMTPPRHIAKALANRLRDGRGRGMPPIPESEQEQPPSPESEQQLPPDMNFGYSQTFEAKYEMRKTLGKGGFAHTFSAKVKLGELRDQIVAVKMISKARLATSVAYADVRREVTIMRALSGHKNVVKFYEACEDADYVYIVMEKCDGGELAEKIVKRRKRCNEQETKALVVQILSVVAFCHLQGVIHRDIKPENILLTSDDPDADIKLIDFGLSNFLKPDEKLTEAIGSVYHAAPEVYGECYSLQADLWSIGVITFELLSGSRPFRVSGSNDSKFLDEVVYSDPYFDESRWRSISPDAKDFVTRLLNKDGKKRMTAVQALTHPWLRNSGHSLPLDIWIYKRINVYLRATPFKQAALMSLSKALPEDELAYLRAQYELLEPKENGVSLENFTRALLHNATDAMVKSGVNKMPDEMAPLAHRRMFFEEFCAAAISPYTLEARAEWKTILSNAFEHFEGNGNVVISTRQLAQELHMNHTPTSLNSWIRDSDGKLSLIGFEALLGAVTERHSYSARYGFLL
ncbi:hypothetical protein K2173_025259 [Erythroxylum novogranatense]|uniref:Protein kinase domain-containing protein n=1 Tax=Erythroxylum novogranatense TaxID=1862640 RepID=A0AAV8UGR3_9ROSI|nr:hypothetical protein K2173_025259 [Erythroxylum novogranatense]